MNPLLWLWGIRDPKPPDAACPCCGQTVKGEPQSWIDARWDPLTQYLEGEITIEQFERAVRVDALTGRDDAA